ncbi:zinc ribbon domain-containing protein [Microcoleus sp. ZQ-A2]|jgi:hypothetical protein|nr:zinc ribbon domain-containing protein [Microcoleus sp. FACHB-1]
MQNCPKCRQSVSSSAVTCPHCRTMLKAYGHPGITLHRAVGDTPLCDSCTYHADDTCNFPQRPLAQECTLYDNRNQRQLERESAEHTGPDLITSFRLYCQQHPTLFGLVGLIAVSLLLTVIVSK